MVTPLAELAAVALELEEGDERATWIPAAEGGV
jgi:hypothetical protein